MFIKRRREPLKFGSKTEFRISPAVVPFFYCFTKKINISLEHSGLLYYQRDSIKRGVTESVLKGI